MTLNGKGHYDGLKPPSANLFQPLLKERDRWVSFRIGYHIDYGGNVSRECLAEDGEKIARGVDANATAATSPCNQGMINRMKGACRRVPTKFNIFGILLGSPPAFADPQRMKRS
jgi:hypothetical protein